MNSWNQKNQKKYAIGLLAMLVSLCVVGCRKSSKVDTAPPAAPVLNSNNVGENPSPLLKALAESKIGWKQLTPTTLNFARESDKLVILFACSSMFADDVKLIKEIENSPALVEQIAENFVPIFVDVEACREVGIISAILSQEAGKPVNFPFMISMTADGNPVSWASLRGGQESVVNIFRNWLNVTLGISKESMDYVKNNSRSEALARKERIKPHITKSDLSHERQNILLGALANLHSYYEKDSIAIANTGNQLPIQYLDLMRASAQTPCLPANIRKTSQEIFLSSLRMLLDSAAVDFIDGGFYFYRTNAAWTLTGSDRNAISQADMVCLLAEAYQMSDDEVFRNAAFRTMEFLQESFGLSDGTYRSFNQMARITDEQRLWTMEDLQASLGSDELLFLKSYCELATLGNIPYEGDGKRRFFRRNALTPRKSLAAAAAACSITELRAEELLVSIREKLSKKRQLMVENVVEEATPDARATLRAASAAVALYRITGKERWKDLAHRSMQALRRTFHSEKIPSYYAASAYPATTDARAGIIVQMAKAALDYYHISGEQTWLDYAFSLSGIIESSYLNEDGIEESPASARLINVPCYDRFMLFDVSTMGILRQNLIRMEQYGVPRIHKLYEACNLEASPMKVKPVIYTDFLTSILYQDFAIQLKLVDPKNTDYQNAFRLSSPGLMRIALEPATENRAVMFNKPDQPLSSPSAIPLLLRP